MIELKPTITPVKLQDNVNELWIVTKKSINNLRQHRDEKSGAPVFTQKGHYTSRGWTEWTQGFQYGCGLLLFEATGDEEYLNYGREGTKKMMATHVSHTGVHDHGFNNVSTYGNLLRMMSEDTIPEDEWQRNYYELALKLSGAVQAARWTELPGGIGYIYSFNGPHSLFCDTIRSLRVLALAHQLGHVLMGEQDEKISLLARLFKHAETTARYNVYFGNGRDRYDMRGRVAQESIFNVKSGAYRCPSTQQGYSPFTTWTRGLSWILLGYSEILEWLDRVTDTEVQASGYRVLRAQTIRDRYVETARAVADFYIRQTPADGIPYWDTGAPGLAKMGDYLSRLAEPFNEYEPVDSSAAAISAQGFLRLGQYLNNHGDTDASIQYTQAGLAIADTLLRQNYLATAPNHEGILLHSVYHYPNEWDYVAPGQKIPNGESCMWGDYHMLELGLYIQRLAQGKNPQCFFNVETASK
jgi:hypothetical protein